MKNINPLGLFDDHFLLEKITKLGDPLKKLNEFIDWKIFETPINEAFKNEDKDLSKGGRPPFNRLMLFKALVLQSLYNLSDDQLEYQIVDRASFKRFLGLKKSDKVPDSKTFWFFREQLIEKNIIMGLFKTFNETLDAVGVFANEGKMVDASFVKVPRQRNTREENKHIKETGTAPKEWKVKPHKLAQKDIDARWTKKNNTTFYGYKNHVKADTKTKLIEEYIVTDASVHDCLRRYFVVSSYAEWIQMEIYLADNGHNYDGTTGGFIIILSDTYYFVKNDIAKSLASTNGWKSSSTTGAVGNTDYPEYRNKSGFTALPGSHRHFYGTFDDIGKSGYFWTATEHVDHGIYRRIFH